VKSTAARSRLPSWPSSSITTPVARCRGAGDRRRGARERSASRAVRRQRAAHFEAAEAFAAAFGMDRTIFEAPNKRKPVRFPPPLWQPGAPRQRQVEEVLRVENLPARPTLTDAYGHNCCFSHGRRRSPKHEPYIRHRLAPGARAPLPRHARNRCGRCFSSDYGRGHCAGRGTPRLPGGDPCRGDDDRRGI